MWLDPNPIDPVQWICREWVGEQGSNKWLNSYDGFQKIIKQRWTEVLQVNLSSAQSKEVCYSIYWLKKVTDVVQDITMFSLTNFLSLFYGGSLTLYSFIFDNFDPTFVDHLSH